jgi:integrase/recombinase XerD
MRMYKLIEQYVAFRRSLGERCHTNGNILRAFGRMLGKATRVTAVSGEQVSTFLTGRGPITSAWHVKHNALLGFYRYAITRGYVTAAPLPAVIPKRPPAFVPYIYSVDEIQRLLRATDSYQHNRSCMEPITLRNLLLLMYATGLRIREVVALNRGDVDFDDSLLTIRQTKFYKTRLVPFQPRLTSVLIQYAARHGDQLAPTAVAPFFTQRSGDRVNQDTLEHSFRRVCEHAGIRRSDGARYQPRLHDVRHTFAVHRLTSWYRQGANVQQLLAQLSVYLGHVHLAATQVYLSMTPELLREASVRFDRYVVEEDCHD